MYQVYVYIKKSKVYLIYTVGEILQSIACGFLRHLQLLIIDIVCVPVGEYTYCGSHLLNCGES